MGGGGGGGRDLHMTCLSLFYHLRPPARHQHCTYIADYAPLTKIDTKLGGMMYVQRAYIPYLPTYILRL